MIPLIRHSRTDKTTEPETTPVVPGLRLREGSTHRAAAFLGAGPASDLDGGDGCTTLHFPKFAELFLYKGNFIYCT